MWALQGIGMLFFGVALVLLAVQPAPDRQGLGMLPVAALGFLLSLVFLLVSRSPRWSPTQVIDLGVTYHVLLAFVIAVLELPRVTGRGVHLDGLSSLTVWQLLLPGLVPLHRRSVISGGVLVATAFPLVCTGAALLGRPIDLGAVAVATLPVVAGGAVGVVFSRVLFGLGRRVQEAREVGSYRLVDRIAQGGMGEVWRAEHRLLRRPAAVKLIRPDLLAPEDPERPRSIDPRAQFEAEAGAIADLSSPHTIELYDYGVRDDGVFFYVMEHLDGLDLRKLVQQGGAFPADRVLHVLHGVALSLAEAHAAGLIHRDIKAANVMLCRQGSSWDVVKVLDFGLVQGRASAPAVDTGRVRGTPQTLAPEIVIGNGATDRSDLYSLGCVAYYLLTGEEVFRCKTTRDWVQAHAWQPAPRPSSRVPVPQVLDDLVLRCLAKEPEARPSALELVAAVEACDGFGAWDRTTAARWWGADTP